MIASRRTAIGLDINEVSICVAELRATAKGLRLVRSSSVPTPPDSVRDGTIVQPKSVARAVRKLLRSVRLAAKGKRVVVSLSGSAVVARVTQLPGGGPGTINKHLQEEIKRYAVFTGDATVSDFTFISPAPGRGEARPALLAVAREDCANAMARTVTRVGMEPSAVGVSFLAVARALYARHLTPQSAAAVVLVVLEAHSVHLIVVQGGAVRFLRTAPLSGDVLDEAARGVPTLASEIRSVLDFYGTQTDDLPEVRGVVVWTGRNAPASISADLSRALGGMPVTVSSPTSISEDAGLLSENGLSRATACAVGLAMRGLGETAFPANLNLLPTATVRVQTLKKRALVTAILAASLFFLALLGMGAVHLRLTALNREMGRTRKSLATVVYPPSAQVVKCGATRRFGSDTLSQTGQC